MKTPQKRRFHFFQWFYSGKIWYTYYHQWRLLIELLYGDFSR